MYQVQLQVCLPTCQPTPVSDRVYKFKLVCGDIHGQYVRYLRLLYAFRRVTSRSTIS